MSKKVTYSRNDVVALRHDDQVSSFNAIADYVEKWKLDWEEVVELLRECADQSEAQAMVVRLRENIEKNLPID